MQEDIEFKKIKSDLLGKIPDQLLDLAISENTALQIAEICLENGVLEEDVEKVGYGVGLVLLGQLPSDGLPIFLEKGLKVSTDVARKIYDKIDVVIFSVVKNDLAKLYKEELSVKPAAKSQKTTPPPEEKPKRPSSKDVYREPVE